MAKRITLPATISPNPFDPLGLVPESTYRSAPAGTRGDLSRADEGRPRAPRSEPAPTGSSSAKGRGQRYAKNRQVRKRKPRPRRRNRESFYVTEQLMERVRNAVAYRSAAPDFLDMSRFAERAFERYVKTLEDTHNGGEPFPARPAFMRKMWARGPR